MSTQPALLRLGVHAAGIESERALDDHLDAGAGQQANVSSPAEHSDSQPGSAANAAANRSPFTAAGGGRTNHRPGGGSPGSGLDLLALIAIALDGSFLPL